MLECIISLVILGIITTLIMVVMPSVRRLQQKSFHDTTDWCLFLQRMESSDYQFRLQDVKTNQLSLYSIAEHESYYVDSGSKAVYLKTDRGGYLPVLVNYCPASLHFRRFNDHCVQVKAKLADGKEQHAIIVFQKGWQCNPDGNDCSPGFKQHNCF